MSPRNSAERIFWKTPELREILYPFLDLESLAHLAEYHDLTRESLKNTLTWGRLVQKTFPVEINLEWDPFEAQMVRTPKRMMGRLESGRKVRGYRKDWKQLST